MSEATEAGVVTDPVRAAVADLALVVADLNLAVMASNGAIMGLSVAMEADRSGDKETAATAAGEARRDLQTAIEKTDASFRDIEGVLRRLAGEDG